MTPCMQEISRWIRGKRNMNRRQLLQAAPSVAGIAIAGKYILSPTTASAAVQFPAPTLNLSIANAAIDSQAIIIADTYNNGIPPTNDWDHAASAANAFADNLDSIGFDATYKTLTSEFTAMQLLSQTYNLNSLLQTVQIYQPSYTMSDLQRFFKLPSLSNMESMLASAQQNGIVSAIRQRAHVYSMPPARLNPALDCTVFDWVIFFGGVAFLTIAAASGVGAIAEGLAWSAIATWGGASVTVAGIIEHVAC